MLSIAFPILNNGPAIYFIATLFSLATALAVASISRRRAVSGDAAIGIFVAATLAWGFIAFAIHAHLGRGGPGGWEDYLLGNATGMSSAAAALAVAISAGIVMTVIVLHRQIVLYCFDPVLAQVTGVPVGFIHYLLILLVAFVIIIGMRLSGNLLVPALLVLPGDGRITRERIDARRDDGRYHRQRDSVLRRNRRFPALAIYLSRSGNRRDFVPGISGRTLCRRPSQVAAGLMPIKSPRCF